VAPLIDALAFHRRGEIVADAPIIPAKTPQQFKDENVRKMREFNPGAPIMTYYRCLQVRGIHPA
jgi:hypothetical protein